MNFFPKSNIQKYSHRLKNNQISNLLNNYNQYNNFSNYNTNQHNSNLSLKDTNNNFDIYPNKEYNTNLNNNIYVNDKRLQIFLCSLGLKQFVVNFQKNGINFEELIGLTKRDLTVINIPYKAQQILEQNIIEYLKYGSDYTIEEIKKFFINKKNRRSNSTNIRKSNNLNYVNIKKNKKIRPKTKFQNNQRMDLNNIHMINTINDDMNNNILQQKNSMNKNSNYNKSVSSGRMSNYPNNNVRDANMVKNKTRAINIIRNNSQHSHMNKKIPIDEFSHLTNKEQSSNLYNYIDLAKFREMNNKNYDSLKRNLSKENKQQNKTKGIISEMNKVLKQIQKRKKAKYNILNKNNNIFTQTNIYTDFNSSNSNNIRRKGYHSDGSALEKKNFYQNNRTGLEVNSYYAGAPPSQNEEILMQRVKKGKIHHSKVKQNRLKNKAQEKKLEQFLNNNNNQYKNYMNNYDKNSVSNVNNTKTTLTNYDNELNQHKKILNQNFDDINIDEYIGTISNINKSDKRKNLLKYYQKNININRGNQNNFSNFKTQINKRGKVNKNESYNSNNCRNNNFNYLNNHIIKDKPVQILMSNNNNSKNKYSYKNTKSKNKSLNSLSSTKYGQNFFDNKNKINPNFYEGIQNINNNINNININNINYDGIGYSQRINNMIEPEIEYRTHNNFYLKNML